MSTRLHRIRATDNTLDVIESGLAALYGKYGTGTGMGEEARFVLDLVRDWRGKPRADLPPATGTLDTDLPNVTIRWRDSGDPTNPHLVCVDCDAELTEVEHRDHITTLVRLARDHECGAPCRHCGSSPDSPDPTCPACPDTERVPCMAGNCTYIADDEEDLERHARVDCAYGLWLDNSDPTRPREVGRAHLDADADHIPSPGDEDECVLASCGLAVTADGRRHGFTVDTGQSELAPVPADVAASYNLPQPATGDGPTDAEVWADLDDSGRRLAAAEDPDRFPPRCDRCGGPWGEDSTCPRCTRSDGEPRDPAHPGPMPDDEEADTDD